jgi:ABC-type lipoprotein release transport system permease subunit
MKNPAGGLFRLAWRELSRDRLTFMLASTGIVAGIAAFVFFTALGEGIRVNVIARAVSSLPVNVLEVTAGGGGSGLLSLAGGTLLGGGEITDEMLGRLKAIPGVARVSPELVLKAPVQANG